MCWQPDVQAEMQALKTQFRELYELFQGIVLEQRDDEPTKESEMDEWFWEEMREMYKDLKRDRQAASSRIVAPRGARFAEATAIKSDEE